MSDVALIVNIVLTLAAVAVGAVVTFLVSRHYYRRASQDLRHEAEELRQETERVRGYLDALVRALHNEGVAEFVWRKPGEPPGVVVRVSATLQGASDLSANATVDREEEDRE